MPSQNHLAVTTVKNTTTNEAGARRLSRRVQNPASRRVPGASSWRNSRPVTRKPDNVKNTETPRKPPGATPLSAEVAPP